MNASTYLKKRQVFWARSQGISLRGSKGERGERAYVASVRDNLLQPLRGEARREYEAGDGRELGNAKTPGKMQAVHSSSAIAANAFVYWRENGDIAAPASALKIPAAGLKSMRFEQKLPIMEAPDRRVFPRDPNIDVLFEYSGGRCLATAVECKFAEAYRSPRGHGLKAAYLARPELWKGLPRIRRFAEAISPDDTKYKHLHPAQLIKHILGLRQVYGSRFRLLYLWYDVPFDEGAAHRREIEEFAAVAQADGVHFQSLTWQEFIIGLAEKHHSKHKEYVNYLVQRYL